MESGMPRQPDDAAQVGDVVTTFQETLDAWTAAQVLAVDPDKDDLVLVVLDWTGPAPAAVSDLGALTALTQLGSRPPGGGERPRQPTRIGVRVLGRRSRGVRNLGPAPLVIATERVVPFTVVVPGAPGWGIGDAVARAGSGRSGHATSDDALALAADDRTDLSVDWVDVHGGGRGLLPAVAAAFPNCRRLDLHPGHAPVDGLRTYAGLRGLRSLTIVDALGLTQDDVLTPDDLPHLEYLDVSSVPAAYLTAMRKAWRELASQGVTVLLRKPRSAAWIAQRTAAQSGNPFREWEDDERLPPEQRLGATAAYRALVAALTAGPGPADPASWLAGLGADYARAFNNLDDGAAGFVGTSEREQIIDAAAAAVRAWAEGPAAGIDAPVAAEALVGGLDRTRDW